MATTTTSSPGPQLTVPYSSCTLALCPISAAQLPYAPSLAGNALFLAIHVACLLANVALGIRFRTWGYAVSMALGCLLEVLGYVGRVMMHFNPFPEDPFLLYLICVTIASIFFTAAIYLCLARLVVVFGEGLSILRPRTYTVLFIVCDFIALVLQAGGGTIVSMADNQDFADIGLRIMEAGLSFQVASLGAFMGLCGYFAWQVQKHPDSLDPRFADLRASRRFRGLLYGLSIATLAMLMRCAFRIAELSGGFHGPIWYNEVDYMVLEGAMIAICTLLLTLAHPGLCFNGRYHEADFQIRRRTVEK